MRIRLQDAKLFICGATSGHTIPVGSEVCVTENGKTSCFEVAALDGMAQWPAIRDLEIELPNPPKPIEPLIQQVTDEEFKVSALNRSFDLLEAALGKIR